MTSYLNVETEAGPDDHPDIHLVQQDHEGDLIGPLTGYNYSETAEASAGLRREAELGYIEAVVACEEGPEAARAAAERARAAANAAAVLDEGVDEKFGTDYPGSNLDYDKQGDIPGRPSFDTREYSEHREAFNEEAGNILGNANVADLYADMAEEAADSIERGEECAPPFLTSDLKLPPTDKDAPAVATALSAASVSPPQSHEAVDMRDPSHRDHPRYARAYTEVTSIDAWPGHSDVAKSERLAAVTTVQTKADGLEAIGRVAMNAENVRAFATDTQDPSVPWAKYSNIDVIAAINTPVEVSNRNLDQLNASLAVREQETARVETRENLRSGPVLA